MRILQVKEYVGIELELVNTGYVAVETNSQDELRGTEIYTGDILDFGARLSGVEITYERPFEKEVRIEDTNWDPDSSNGWSTPRIRTRIFEEVPLEDRPF